MAHDLSVTAKTDLERWNQLLRPYASPVTADSLIQLALTLGLLAVCAALMLTVNLHFGYWASLPMAVPTGAMVVRTFIIQHDCGHYSFFRHRWACDWLGRVLGVLTFTPYYWWKRDHDWHHASSGDLSRRGFGDVTTLTVREYLALTRWRRLKYRAYRNPLVLFGIGPAWQFLVRHHLPLGIRGRDRKAIGSILAHNLVLAALFVVFGWLLGFGRVSALWLPVIVVAASVGVWLFFIQHQFADTYWRERRLWSFVAASLQGCSYYHLPAPLEWLTGWIGYHHIHHMAARIPCYRLPACFRDIPALRNATVITLRQSLACSRLALWCEERGRLLSFREALSA